MDESKDPSRTGKLDWMGALLGVVGLGGIVLGLLEWPPLGPGHPLVIGALLIGAVGVALLVVVELRVANPMLPFKLFRSRTFTLANILTLLLYGALGVVLFLLPLDLIQVQHYTATEAGAALVPLAIIMFTLSRWAGGLINRVGPRIPLTIGPAIVAVGVALLARGGTGGSYWTTVFPAVCLLGFGMTITVAPLTTAVMGAVETQHSGVASGINNTVSASRTSHDCDLGVFSGAGFESDVRPRLDHLALPAAERAQRRAARKWRGELKAIQLTTSSGPALSGQSTTRSSRVSHGHTGSRSLAGGGRVWRGDSRREIGERERV